ncbi:XRE family transcriptional regulator [Actinomadura parmotrematis]|uniref:XRE family transcriptional regulator n=1 Tax=Actinomadura parmotrematis TaxID=2864039 RepID=A0ABS7FUY7_9ACTN|nr:XRE family transcriptional regulator [Actinomadura parmotrematis]MBW8484106.1 XRE family transcriptional regulator [Actinomadura parmotrematis]
MDDDRPVWAKRITAEREARKWNKPQFIEALRAHSDTPLPGKASLLRRVHSWESGESRPDDFYRPLIAKTFGTVTAAIWPVAGSRESDAELVAGAGMDTLEILTRLRSSSVDAAVIEGLRITVNRLCSEYPHMPAEQLLLEGRAWLRRITTMLDRHLSLAHHRELLSLAGWLAALVGCVEYDATNRPAAEATRQAALSLGEDSGDTEIIGWAQEMRAWFSITRGDYRGVLAAAEAGHAAAPHSRAAVQLYAQMAKAWARIGDRRQVEVALDQGRALLEQLPYPDNLDHHFAVDPAKWDFYSMDCYRILGHGQDAASTENKLAESYAQNVIQTGTDAAGVERSPMRNAEARVTLGVIAVREGELEKAVEFGERALQGQRQSLPSLAMVSRELGTAITEHYGSDSSASEYLHHLRQLQSSAR